MFYRLVAIDDCALPAPMVIDTTEYRVSHGGLLLEPPGGSRPVSIDGYGILKFFGGLKAGDAEFLASSSESYRWRAPGMLDFSRPSSSRVPRFSGLLTGDRLDMVAEPGADFIRPGSRLALVAAPDTPVDPRWENTFNFGPPHVQPVDPALRDDPTLIAAIQASILAGESARLRAAAARLEAAWRAPA